MIHSLKPLLAAILITLLTTACTDSDLATKIQVVKPQQLQAPIPSPLRLNTVKWQAQNSSTLAQTIAKQESNTVYFLLTAQDAKKVQWNQLEQERYINQLQKAILFYRDQNSQSNSIQE